MFFNSFNEHMRDIFLKDIDKHNILAWIIYNTNYNPKGYKGLKLHQCYITNSTVVKDTRIDKSKVQRTLKALENEGYFKYFVKSEGGKKPSIINVNFSIWCDAVNDTENDTVDDTVATIENTKFETCYDIVSDTVDDKVNDISSKKEYKKESKKIYSASSEALWKLYPHKKNKAKAMLKIPNLISKYGYGQIEKCIKRYIDYVENERRNGFKSLKYQAGSTFFNGTYIDYLDENYHEKPKEQPLYEKPRGKVIEMKIGEG